MNRLTVIIFALLLTFNGCDIFENENEIPPRIEINPNPVKQGEVTTITIAREEEFYILYTYDLTFTIEKLNKDIWEVYEHRNVFYLTNIIPRRLVQGSITDTLSVKEEGVFKIVTNYKNEEFGPRFYIESKPFRVTTGS